MGRGREREREGEGNFQSSTEAIEIIASEERENIQRCNLKSATGGYPDHFCNRMSVHVDVIRQ
jgi:hypothetical protein